MFVEEKFLVSRIPPKFPPVDRKFARIATEDNQIRFYVDLRTAAV